MRCKFVSTCTTRPAHENGSVSAMWLAKTTPQGRRAVWAAYGGYGLDGFDFMVYSFIGPSLLTVWGMSKAEAGYIGTGALLTSAVGGSRKGVRPSTLCAIRQRSSTSSTSLGSHSAESIACSFWITVRP